MTIRLPVLEALVELELAWEENYVQHANPIPKKIKAPSLPQAKLHPLNRASMAEHAKTFSSGGQKHPGHLNSIEEYKSNSSLFNTPLRKMREPSKSYQKHFENMKHVTSHEMKAPQLSYRGNKMKVELPVGHKFTDRGFSGTSLDPQIATNDDWSNHNNVFAIHAPKGAKGYHLDRHRFTNENEKELTYHPDTHYQVIGHTNHSYVIPSSSRPQRVTHVAIVGQGYKDGKPDLSLTQSPEGKRWLEDVRKNHPKMVGIE